MLEGFNLPQGTAGIPSTLLVNINRNDIVLLGINRIHQLHSADDGYLTLTASAAKDDAQLCLAHISSAVTVRNNYPADHFQTTPHRRFCQAGAKALWPLSSC